MDQIRIIHINPSGLAAGGPFDFRVDGSGTEPPDAARIPTRPETGIPAALPAFLHAPDTPIVVHGHRQIDAAAHAGRESIPGLLYPDSTPAKTVIALSLEHGAGHHLTGIEKILAIYKTSLFGVGGLDAVRAGGPVSVPEWILPLHEILVGRRVSRDYAERMCKALSFPTPERRALVRLGFSIDQIAPLLTLNPDERAVVIQICETSAFTTAQVRQLVKLVVLSRGRSGFDLGGWRALAEKEFTDGAGVVRWLEKSIHPQLTARRRQIEEAIAGMRLPTRVRITPPENLEGESFSCYFRFSRLAELENYVKLFERVLESGQASRLLDLLNGDVADTEAR